MHALLVSQPAPHFDRLLGIAQQALGFSLSAKLDASPFERTEAERFVSCLAAMKGRPPGLQLLNHVSFSVLIATDAREMSAVLEKCEMPFVVADTVKHGVQLAVVSGTLAQWKAAVERGLDEIKTVFVENGLDVWNRHLLEDSR